jgi:holo-[acyl-carrier protein] synthase
MIAGIGVDVCDINKLKKPLKNNKRFVERVFSKKEIEYCKNKKNWILHFAGRFAVKEAFLKAISDKKDIPLCEIETVNNSAGKPEIANTGIVKKILKQRKIKNMFVSISHIDSLSVAICILEK